jgi:hypothetical protein
MEKGGKQVGGCFFSFSFFFFLGPFSSFLSVSQEKKKKVKKNGKELRIMKRQMERRGNW